MNKTLLLSIGFLLILGIQSPVLAQRAGAEHTIVEAKEMLRNAMTYANRDLFQKAKMLLNPLKTEKRLAALASYYLGYIDNQMGVVIERMDKERVVVYLDSAVEHLERAIEHDERFAEAHALLASCYGMKIGLAPLKGIILGPKSASMMSTAKTLAPSNPRVALLDAISTYNTPALFGGGKEKGLTALKRAAELFDLWKDSDPLQPSWGREEVYAWIGLAHLGRKETILAKRAFDKSLEINPDYGWVKYSLMPRLEKEVRSEK